MKLEEWLGPRSVLSIVAALASLEFGLNSLVAFRAGRDFEFFAWLSGAALSFVLAALVENVKVAGVR